MENHEWEAAVMERVDKAHLNKYVVSKLSCPACGQHRLVTNDAEKLITNDAEKFDAVVYSHCLNCGYEFSENKQQRKYHDSQREYQSSPKSDYFWDKATRIVVISIGGASIGAAIAQLPGAVLGGLSAAGYGLYISFSDSGKAAAKNL